MMNTTERLDIDATATRLAGDWLDRHRETKKDWLEHDRSAGNPEGPADVLTDMIADKSQETLSIYGYALSYLACRFDLTATPEVRTEVLDSTIKLIVSVKDTWIGTLTYVRPGGAEACMAKETFRVGQTVEMNGELTHRWFCFDPAHKAQGGLQ